MARKAVKFEARFTISGSNGVALYFPSHIVKSADLKSRVNQKVPCVLDDDGDVIVYLNDVEEDEVDDDDDEEE